MNTAWRRSVRHSEKPRSEGRAIRGSEGARRAADAAQKCRWTRRASLCMRRSEKPRSEGRAIRGSEGARRAADAAQKCRCPRQDSNLRTRLRRPMLYPLSYEGGASDTTKRAPAANERCAARFLRDDVGEQFER